ncbi:hypothetical protein KEM54_005209 [Ascosphaera aggregata]|nr:hypothetical protein KEM54_005209 [Ascosphaera aggregata]
MSSFAYQGIYSDNLEPCFNYLGVSDILDQKTYLSADIHPFYPLGVNIASSERHEPGLWDGFLPVTFNDINAITLPNAFETELDMMQASGAVFNPPVSSVEYDQRISSEIPIAPFPPSSLGYLQNDYQYVGKHPTELESSDQCRFDDPMPVPPAESPDDRSFSQDFDHLKKPIDSETHPSAKRLSRSRFRNTREPYAAATVTATRSSQSKPRIRKATSFNCSFSSNHTSRKTRSMAKSKSVPHMTSNVTSHPREEHASGHKVSLTKEKFAFVNYTMEDKDEILAAVAPSGTMKTRARREQEAREEARRLEEAALAAIRRAGGDPKDLKLFMH